MYLFREHGFALFLINLAITYTVCSLPIMIYRYRIRKYAVPRRKAFWVSVLYGVFAFFVTCVIAFFLNGNVTGKAVVFWSMINFAVLTKERKYDYLNYPREDESDPDHDDA